MQSVIYSKHKQLCVTFTNTSTTTSGFPNKIVSYWNFGDNTTSNEKNPVKTYSSSGYKVVSLTINDSFGCFQTYTGTILITAVGNFCNASFTKSFSGLSIYFQNTSKNRNGLEAGLTSMWDFGDGTTSTQRNPTKIYLTGGPKLVQLTISDTTQGCFDTYFDSLFLVGPTVYCSARFEVGFDTTTPFQFSILNTSFVRPNSTYLWTFGDGGSSNLLAPSHTYANFGSYLVCLTVSDSLCTSIFCDSVGMDSSGTLL